MRMLRRIVMVGSLVIAAFALVVVMLLTVLHTDLGRAIARDRLAALLAHGTGGRVRLAALETPRPGTVVLRDLVVSLRGQSVLRARRLEIEIGLPLPMPPVLRLRRVRIDGLAAHLVRRDGSFGEAPPSGEPSRVGLRIHALEVRGARLGVRLADATPRRQAALSALSLEAALAHGPRGSWLSLTSLTATPRGLPLEPLTAALTLRADSGGGLDLGGFELTSGATRVAGAGRRAAGGRLDVRLRAAPLAPDLLGRAAPGLVLPDGSRIDVELHGPPSALGGTSRVHLAAAGEVTLRGRGDVTAEPVSYRVALEARDLVPGALHAGWTRDRLQASLRGHARGDRYRAHGRASSEAGSVVWQGLAALGGEATYRLRASGEVRDLARLSPVAGRFPFRVDAGATGPLRRPERARLAVEVGRGTLATQAIRQASASAHLERSQVRAARLRIESDTATLLARGRGDLERRALEAELDLTQPGRGRATATIGLGRAPRGLSGSLRTVSLAPERLPPWTSEAPAALTIGHGFRVDDLRLRSGAQRAVLSVSVGGRGALGGALVVSDVQLAPLCELAGRACAGVLGGRLDASGTTTAPRLALTATGRDVAAGPIARSTIEANLRHERGRASGTVTVASLGGSVVVTGGIPAPLPASPAQNDALDLTITARRLALTRLAVMAPRVVREARGRLRADLHIGGTWAVPRPQGTLTLRAPVLELVASGARWEDVHVVLRADGGTALVIERLAAVGGAGTLTGSGRLDFATGLLPSADVRLVMDRFLAVDRSILTATVNGTLRLRGPLTGPTVRGRLYVPEGAVRPAFLPTANASIERDPTIEVVGLPEDVTTAPAPGLGELTLGLTITLGNGMRIRRRDADIQLGGTLRVERTPPEALRVSGAVKIERGWYTFSGRRFRMRPGEVRFDGGPVGDAELDLEATRRTGEYDVTVAVQGTVAKPELLLSSDPPLDDPDVLAVLLVGRPGGELSESERLAVQAEAASLAMGYVAPGLSSGVEEVLPLEEVQVSPEQVRVGHRIAGDVFVSLSQQFVGWAGQTAAVEYEITPRLSVELSTSSRGSGAIDFFWRRRY